MVEQQSPERRSRKARVGALLGIAVLAASLATYNALSPDHTPETKHEVKAERHEAYSIHRNITATIFWVGEAATQDNDFIHNSASAWLDDWQAAYGGVDDPNNRCGWLPCGFTPKENSFYFALPYNDLHDDGSRKASARNIPWYGKVIDANPTSVVKNHWIKITLQKATGEKTAYAQWEDAGPFVYDDFDYVFGDGKPTSNRAGLDLSPATASYLGINGRGAVSWQFVDDLEVPDGPWKEVITTSN